MELFITLVVSLLGTMVVSCFELWEGNINESLKEPPTYTLGRHSEYVPTNKPKIDHIIQDVIDSQSTSPIQESPPTGEGS